MSVAMIWDLLWGGSPMSDLAVGTVIIGMLIGGAFFGKMHADGARLLHARRRTKSVEGLVVLGNEQALDACAEMMAAFDDRCASPKSKIARIPSLPTLVEAESEMSIPSTPRTSEVDLRAADELDLEHVLQPAPDDTPPGSQASSPLLTDDEEYASAAAMQRRLRHSDYEGPAMPLDGSPSAVASVPTECTSSCSPPLAASFGPAVRFVSPQPPLEVSLSASVKGPSAVHDAYLMKYDFTLEDPAWNTDEGSESASATGGGWDEEEGEESEDGMDEERTSCAQQPSSPTVIRDQLSMPKSASCPDAALMLQSSRKS